MLSLASAASEEPMTNSAAIEVNGGGDDASDLPSQGTQHDEIQVNVSDAVPTTKLGHLDPVPMTPLNVTEDMAKKKEDAHLFEKYPLYGFARDHFLLSAPRKFPFGRAKAFNLEARLQWERELLTSPLTKLTGDQAKLALQAFRNISGFMGNRSSGKGQIDHCFKLLRNVMPKPTAIKDEIYCQLCKQLTRNPNSNAALNGWLLLHACVVTFPSSKALSPYLESFVMSHIGVTESKVSQFASGCLAALHHWTKVSERKELPSLREIEALRDLTNVELSISLIDGSTFRIPVSSWTTCGVLNEMVAVHLGVCKKPAFTLFDVSPTGEEHRVEHDERVLDLLALWERIGIEQLPKKKKKKKGNAPRPSKPAADLLTATHHLRYKVYLHLPIDEDMLEDLQLFYLQAVHDVVNGGVVCSHDDCVQLAAYQLQIASGYGSTVKLEELSRDLHKYVAPNLISKANQLDMAMEVLDAFATLSDQPTQQLRRAYLRICDTSRLYGATFFPVHNTRTRSMPSEIVLVVNHKGISLLSLDNDSTLHHFPYVSIATWGYSSASFVFVVSAQEGEEVEYVFKTKMGKAINDVVAAYVAYILSCEST
ncbi:hypothetical protein Poli38472_014804 [Pythium oligandrum]|uniref:MyTH4 domain-containing protein n=1 Tax=Pythium oligandrum TaxID=41045 RepID=A0A8K1CHW4_PYTOL|nr:hypothetical protein Poli38472_014804 [Pythium oligandrum]|eukprot:TMW63894.1 hypothetical protein Poli38472_014804 [Pythium oligandrum]